MYWFCIVQTQITNYYYARHCWISRKGHIVGEYPFKIENSKYVTAIL